MKKIIMGIGIPGSGKTTVLKDFATKNGYSYICPDDIRLELTGNSADQTKNREVWDLAYKRSALELEKGNTVVFDATFANHKQRIDFIKFGKENGAEKVQGLFLDVSLDLAKERNKSRDRVVPEHALDRMAENLQRNPPEIDDGFDSIFYIDEFGKITDVDTMIEDKFVSREFNKLI